LLNLEEKTGKPSQNQAVVKNCPESTLKAQTRVEIVKFLEQPKTDNEFHFPPLWKIKTNLPANM